MCSTVEECHDACGGISRVPWEMCSIVEDIMMNVGDILSTVGMLSAMGGYHEYHGGYLSTVGENLLLFEYPYGTEHPLPPMVLMIYPHSTHDIPPRY